MTVDGAIFLLREGVVITGAGEHIRLGDVMKKEKRSIVIFDGQVYKLGELIQDPIMVKVGLNEINTPTGEFKKTLKVVKSGSLIEVSVSHYTITLRKSGRYVYEFFGKISRIYRFQSGGVVDVDREHKPSMGNSQTESASLNV